MRLIIHLLWNNWHVHLHNNSGVWATGNTIVEALGSFLLTHPEQFTGGVLISIVRPSEAKMRNCELMKGRELANGTFVTVVETSPDGFTPPGV